MAEDAEVGSGMNSTTRSAENSPLGMAEDIEVGGNSDGANDETDKRSPSKKSSGPIGYLTSLRSNADSVPFAKRWVSRDSFGYSWSFQLEVLPKWLRAKFAGTTKLNSHQVRGTYDTILHQLSSYNFRAPVFFSVALLLWARHFRTNTHLKTHSYKMVTLFILYWQNAFFFTAALVLQYVLNQANWQILPPGLLFL